ncbi:MAG TPA: hypothetical protein VG847_08900 [Chitinophagaceae bacterium]|nr:hypothetical protein [Chitinophagaceae bacterium]
MKIEQAIVLYLIKNKSLPLQGIGSFRIEGSFPETSDDKPQIIPAEAISFVYDPKTAEDPELINFLVQTTKKIKPLASADLDSFLTLGRQFLNIGKPFVIHNLGVLEKTNAGAFEFRGGPVVQRPEPQPVKIEDVTMETAEEAGFNDFEKASPRRNGRSLLYIFVLVLLATAGWAAWKYIFNKNQNTPVNSTTENIVPLKDTTATSTEKKNDSVPPVDKKEDSLKNTPRNPADTFTFKVVVYETKDLALARAKMDKWINMGRKIILYTDDSVTYKIAHPFTLPLSDTTKILDSLNNYYYLGRAHIEINK